MKIIARVDGSIFLAEVSLDELAKIQGFHSKYTPEFQKHVPDVGSEIDVDRLFTLSRLIREINPEGISAIKNHLTSLNQVLDAVEHEVNKFLLFDTLKNPQENNQ